MAIAMVVYSREIKEKSTLRRRKLTTQAETRETHSWVKGC